MLNRIGNKSLEATGGVTLCAGLQKSRWPPEQSFALASAAALTPEIRMVIHARVDLLFDLITEAQIPQVPSRPLALLLVRLFG